METRGVRILAFGVIAEQLNASVLILPGVCDTEQVADVLMRKYPQLANMKFSISVDQVLAREALPVNETSEVALLPPFSGG